MKTLKKLSFVLAFAFTLFAAGCSDIAVEPQWTDDDDDVIIIGPQPKPATAIDSVTIG